MRDIYKVCTKQLDNVHQNFRVIQSVGKNL